MPVFIEGGDGKGVYTRETPRPLLDAVAVVINRAYAGIRVKHGPLPFIQSSDIYRFASLDALARYMLQIDPYGVPAYNLVPPQANLPAPTLTFGTGHGDLHFGGDPTEKKSKWSLTKAKAIELMAAEITKHLPRMRRESQLDDWEAWYIGGQVAGGEAGRYYKKGTRGGLPTDMFTIQAQVHWLDNEISYHGFPDERLVRTGLGKSKSTIV